MTMITENHTALVPFVATPINVVPYREVEAYVQQYLGFAKKSAENIIGLAKTLARAKADLTQEDLDIFCGEVGLDQTGSTYRKLTLIGDRAERFDPYLDQMPSTWTTVYKLAKLSEPDFDKVANSDAFSQFITAKEIAEIVPPKTKRGKARRTEASSSSIMSEQTREKYVITIDLGMIEDHEKQEVRNEIYILQNNYQFGLTVSDDFTALAKRIEKL